MAKKVKPEDPDKKYQFSITAKSFLNKENDASIGGRPKAPINWDKVETAMELGCSLDECAKFGGVYPGTLERRVMERYGDLFRVVRTYFMGDRKMMSRNALYKAVARGNIPAILFVNRAINRMNDRLREDEDEDEGDTGTFKLAFDPYEAPPIDAEYTQEDE